jgi:hypothetical protein
VIETVQRVTPLGVAFHDLLTDAVITDGLAVSARPTARSYRFHPACATPRGVHVIADIPGLRDLEFPRPAPGERVQVDFDLDGAGLVSRAELDVDVLVEDRLGRFLRTVLQLTAPQRGLATAADVLWRCPRLVSSVPDDAPVFLMSSPQRAVPPTTAVVRACLRHHVTREPAAHAVLAVDTPAGRSVGVADAAGNVVVAFAYPRFTTLLPPDSTPPGSHGLPTADQTWDVQVSVRWEPGVLSFPVGVAVPRAHSVFCQRSGTVFAHDGGLGTPDLPAVLQYGTPLVLSTDGVVEPDRASFLFVRPAL